MEVENISDRMLDFASMTSNLYKMEDISPITQFSGKQVLCGFNCELKKKFFSFKLKIAMHTLSHQLIGDLKTGRHSSFVKV